MPTQITSTFADFFVKSPPILWLVCGIVLCFFVLQLTGPILGRGNTDTKRSAISVFSITCIAAYLAIAIYYAQSIVLLDHTDPTFIITSALWGRGQPIYHALDSANRYSLPYGPLPYMIDYEFQKILGPTIRVAKSAPVAAAISSLAILLLVIKRNASWTTSLLSCACAAITLAFFADSSYWVRADPFLIFFVCVGLAATRLRSASASAILCGIAMGCAADVKVHGVLPFLPLLALILRDRGWKPAVATIPIAVIVALLPFLIFPASIPMRFYMQWLGVVAGHRLFDITLPTLLDWTLMLALPCLIAAASFAMADANPFKRWCASYKFVLATLAAGFILTIIPASKEGAGPHHFMPFVPIFAYLFSRLITDHPRPVRISRFIEILSGGYLIAAILIASANQAKIVRFILRHQQSAQDAIAEIRTAPARFPGQTIAVGYSDQANYIQTYYRVIPVLEGNPCLIDATAIMDMEEANMHLPPATLESIRAGDTRVWLIPTGGDPFTLINFYPLHPILFPPEFRQIFLQHYRKEPLGKVFDAWVYQP